MLRYDVTGPVAEVSVYLAPSQLGRGLGAPLLVAGSDWLCQHAPAVQRIDARIVPANIASSRVFERAGYLLDHSLFQLHLGG